MIYLEEVQFERLKELSRKTGESLAAIIRKALDGYLAQARASKKSDPIFKIVGIGKSPKRNRDSIDHDKLLYDQDKNE